MVSQVIVYSLYHYLKSSFISNHINRFLDAEDQISAELYNLKFLLITFFLLPYTKLEYQWKLFTVLTQNDFTSQVQIQMTHRSKKLQSLLLKFSFWCFVELILYSTTPFYTLKLLVYVFYSLEALLKSWVNYLD